MYNFIIHFVHLRCANIMGMYDSINGEQVKCFPWVSFYKEEISYHGGDLKDYKTRSNVPFQKPHYNYGKNFVILDLNRFPDSSYSDYDFILHVVENGKVKKTYRDEIGTINWSKNQLVVGYYGELLNIHSNEELQEYMVAQRKYWDDYKEIHKHWDELFSESMKYFSGMGLLESGSEEKEFRLKKLEELKVLKDKEEERIASSVKALQESHSKWFVDTSKIDDLIRLGEFISAYNISYHSDKNEKETCKKIIQAMISKDSSLLERYEKWQETDKYTTEIKEWKELEKGE